MKRISSLNTVVRFYGHLNPACSSSVLFAAQSRFRGTQAPVVWTCHIFRAINGDGCAWLWVHTQGFAKEWTCWITGYTHFDHTGVTTFSQAVGLAYTSTDHAFPLSRKAPLLGFSWYKLVLMPPRNKCLINESELPNGDNFRS